jgi:hypothetical protein
MAPALLQEGGSETPSTFFTGSFFTAGVSDVANADMPGATDSQIDAAFTHHSSLNVQILPGDSAELDCGGTPNPSPPPPLLGGLVYCSSGGTGMVSQADGSPPERPFPDCCDPDDDGYGRLFAVQGTTPLLLSPRASSDQIGTGDVLIQRVTTAGVETQYASAVPFVFATVPTLVSYSDNAGNAATVPYPVAPSSGIPGSGGPGTNGNGLEIAAGPDGDIVVTLTLWRPQRRPIPPETGGWFEMGGLNYLLGLHDYSSGQGSPSPCPQDAYSSADPNLAPASTGHPGLTDLTSDRPADPANTFTFTVNITKCLANVGLSWGTGQERTIEFQAEAAGQANSGYSNASQSVQFVLGPLPSESPSPSASPT